MQKNIKYTGGGDLLSHDDAQLGFDSVYSKTFVESINHRADDAVWSSDYINEIFMYFYVKIMEYSSFFKGSGTEELQMKDFSNSWSIYIAAARSVDLKINLKAILLYHLSNIILILYSFIVISVSSFLMPAWLLVKRKRREQKIYDNISVVRSPASYDKMKFLEESNQAKFYFDDVVYGGVGVPSLYSNGNNYQRFLVLLRVPLMAIKDYFLIIRDINNLLGWQHAGFVLSYFSKRIVHKCLFEYFLDLTLKRNKQAIYYTGNKEDRFAVVEMRLCKKLGMKSVCIPHGIEYAFRFPAGLAGDIFYCTTPFAQQHLSNLYGDDNKYIYDKDVAVKMFSRGQAVSDIEEIVFFPESREPEINLSILKVLVESGFSILVKLHIKDNPENYQEYSDRFSYIDDFDAAISNKICLARKSTVLVEAIYNNSIPIAVLVDPKDRAYVEYMFPSLRDSQIGRVFSFEELVKRIHEVKTNIALNGLHATRQ